MPGLRHIDIQGGETLEEYAYKLDRGELSGYRESTKADAYARSEKKWNDFLKKNPPAKQPTYYDSRRNVGNIYDSIRRGDMSYLDDIDRRYPISVPSINVPDIEKFEQPSEYSYDFGPAGGQVYPEEEEEEDINDFGLSDFRTESDPYAESWGGEETIQDAYGNIVPKYVPKQEVYLSSNYKQKAFGDVEDFITYKSTDYVSDITSSTTPFLLVSIPINPGLTFSFPKLSSLANAFTFYRFRKLKLVYTPLSGESLSSTNTSLGYCCITYSDPADDPFVNRTQMANNNNCITFSPSDSAELEIDCTAATDKLYCRNNLLEDFTNKDIRLDDLATLYIATGNSLSANTIGQLRWEYEIDLIESKLSGAQTGDNNLFYCATLGQYRTGNVGTYTTSVLAKPDSNTYTTVGTMKAGNLPIKSYPEGSTSASGVGNRMYFPPNLPIGSTFYISIITGDLGTNRKTEITGGILLDSSGGFDVLPMAYLNGLTTGGTLSWNAIPALSAGTTSGLSGKLCYYSQETILGNTFNIIVRCTRNGYGSNQPYLQLAHRVYTNASNFSGYGILYVIQIPNNFPVFVTGTL